MLSKVQMLVQNFFYNKKTAAFDGGFFIIYLN